MAWGVATRQERRFREERLQRGSPHGPTARNGGLGKKGSRRALCPANGKKGGLGEKGFRGAWGEGGMEEKAVQGKGIHSGHYPHLTPPDK